MNIHNMLTAAAIALFAALWTYCRIRNRNEAARLTREFENDKQNDAVEVAICRPAGERRELLSRLKGVIFYKLRTNPEDSAFYLEKLYLFEPEEARQYQNSLRNAIIDKIAAMVEEKGSVEALTHFLLWCVSNDNPATAVLEGKQSVNGYIQRLRAASAPFISIIVERIMAGETVELPLRTILPLLILIPDKCIPIRISARTIEALGTTVPLANFVIDGLEADLYLGPSEIYHWRDNEPIQGLLHGVMAELQSRLPEAERQPAQEVLDAIRKKHEAHKQEVVTFNERARRLREEDERVNRELACHWGGID